MSSDNIERSRGSSASRPSEQILDATCGGRSIWLDENKQRPDTLYIDRREEAAGFVDEAVSDPPNNPNYEVAPDETEDFRDLPYPDESFNLVVFDPPHIVRGDGMKTLTGVMTKKYGALNAETWQDDLRRGFLELFRVLTRGGTLVFKFSDESVDFRTVVDLAPRPPLFGTTVRGGGSNIETRWFVFCKPEEQRNNRSGGNDE